MSKGRDATTITDSTGRRRITKLWDGAAAARCGRLRAGPAVTPRRPRACVGSAALWSCALALGPSRRRARRCRDAHPPRRCCFVSGTRPYRTGARRVQSFLGPATRRWSSCRSTRTAGADERAARGRKPPPRHRRDVVLVTASARRRASRPTHTRERASTRGDRAPPAQWTSTAR